MYSPDEIEKKRLLALKLRQNRMQNTAPAPVPTPKTPVRNVGNTQPTKIFLKRSYNSNSITSSSSSSSSLASISSTMPMKKMKTIAPASFFDKIGVVRGNCYMITPTRFEVDVPYHQPVIEFFKLFSSRLYDQKTKLWSFDLKEYDEFNKKLKITLPKVQLVGIPKVVIQTFSNLENNSANNEKPDFSRIDEKLWNSLMPFQKEGVAFGIQKKGRCIIADDMGLGKTLQALGIAHYYRDDWPLLIVTPSSVRFQWSDAIYEFLPSVPIQYVQQFANVKDCLGSEMINIVSYDLLVRASDTFARKKFGTIILDESHFLKNHKTERTKAVQCLTNNASRIILLSGTPALSRPIELYSQMCLVLGSFMKLQEYGLRYCDGKRGRYGWDFTRSSNVTELQLLLQARCLLRRLKSDVLKQLPSKIRRVIILDPALVDKDTDETAEIIAQLEGNKIKGIESHTTMLQLYNAAGNQKIRAIRNYVKDLVENDKKFLIFAHHQSILTAICEVLKDKKIQFIKIDGKTSAENRKQQVDRFQECEDCMVAVLSITAANAGITLTAAHFVVFAELYWNPGILVQAEDRVHRIGQDSGVIIQYLVAKGTVDDYLWKLLQKKLRFLTEAGLNQNFSLNEVKVSNQATTHNEENSSNGCTQTTLDSFINKSNTSVSSQLSDDLDKLLDENEEDFANVDLDLIENGN